MQYIYTGYYTRVTKMGGYIDEYGQARINIVVSRRKTLITVSPLIDPVFDGDICLPLQVVTHIGVISKSQIPTIKSQSLCTYVPQALLQTLPSSPSPVVSLRANQAWNPRHQTSYPQPRTSSASRSSNSRP